MDESLKRKERLKAMRMEAAESGVWDDGRNSVVVSQSLVNPLVEGNSPSTIRAEPLAAPRFDYYTDPMAAFSANKRSSKVSHQFSPHYTIPPRPGNVNSTLPPVHQANSSPDMRYFRAQGSCYSPGPFRSPTPVGTPNPYNTPQGNINHWGASVGSSPNFFPSNLPSGNPGFGHQNNPSLNYGGQGRGYRFNNTPQSGSGFSGSPYHNPGRGKSTGLGSSGRPGTVQGGSRNAVSAELRPDMYYKKSMVEDPWKGLKPTLWKQTNLSSSTNLDSSNSWLPNSIRSKKSRVSVTPNKYKSGQSLAEYLAASFNEAANETDDNDAGQNI